MSALLLFSLPVIYRVVVPVAALLLAIWLWSHMRTKISRVVVAFAALAGGVWLAWLLFEGDKHLADAKVRRLCEIDGGIKVYETVKLPPEKFNKWGQVNFYNPTQGDNALGSTYLYSSKEEYLQRGNPRVIRYHIQVVRKSDEKLLGESISYVRGGGDLPNPGNGSSFHCPRAWGDIALMSNIFVMFKND